MGAYKHDVVLLQSKWLPIFMVVIFYGCLLFDFTVSAESTNTSLAPRPLPDSISCATVEKITDWKWWTWFCNDGEVPAQYAANQLIADWF